MHTSNERTNPEKEEKPRRWPAVMIFLDDDSRACVQVTRVLLYFPFPFPFSCFPSFFSFFFSPLQIPARSNRARSTDPTSWRAAGLLSD